MDDLEMVLKVVLRVIVLYSQKASTMSVNDLLIMQDELSINSYYIATYLGDKKDDYNTIYFQRKTYVSNRTQELMNQPIIGTKRAMAKNAAEIQAVNEAEDNFYEEMKAQATSYKLEKQLIQMNKILQSISSRVSWLKKESEQSRQQQTP